MNYLGFNQQLPTLHLTECGVHYQSKKSESIGKKAIMSGKTIKQSEIDLQWPVNEHSRISNIIYR